MRDLWERRRWQQRVRSLIRPRRPNTYAYRGERERDARRVRRALLLAALVCTSVTAAWTGGPEIATAATLRPVPMTRLLARRPVAVHADVPAPRFAVVADSHPRTHRDLSRVHRVNRFATRYGIAPELATAIHDAAVDEGLEPELAFRLVRAESEFNERARSRVGAVGLTQLMPGTARYFVGPVTRERLYDRQLNLHVGFRYLRGLIREYRSLRLALLVYNRGPVAVRAALDAGTDPANGYELLVAKGYRGRGTID